MLTADAAAGIHTQPQDRGPQIFHPLVHALLAAVVKDQRMQVAVSSVENIGHRQLMLTAEFIDPG